MKSIIPLLLAISVALPVTLNAADEEPAADTATPATTEPTETPAADQSPQALAQKRQFDLATAQHPETEIIWLDTGDGEQLALLQRSVLPNAHGAILVFPDRGTHADWPALINPLRTQLVEYGWHTLVMDLPLPPAATIPERTLPTLQQRGQIQNDAATETTSEEGEETAASPEATENSENTITEAGSGTDSTTAEANSKSNQNTDKINYNEEVSSLASQAIGQLPPEGELRILMGIGEGSGWALQFARQHSGDSNYTVVLINPTQSSIENSPDLNQLLAETEIPVLDLWFSGNLYQKSSAKLRKRTALRSSNENYRQIRLNQQLNDPRRIPLWLTKQVRGIMKTHILDKVEVMPETPEAAELTPGS